MHMLCTGTFFFLPFFDKSMFIFQTKHGVLVSLSARCSNVERDMVHEL